MTPVMVARYTIALRAFVASPARTVAIAKMRAARLLTSSRLVLPLVISAHLSARHRAWV